YAIGRQRADLDPLGPDQPEDPGAFDVAKPRRIAAAEPKRSGERAKGARDGTQKRRLADAVRTDEADELAGSDREVDAGKHGRPPPAPAIADGKARRADGGRAHPMNAPFRARRRTKTTTGAPISAVTA